MAIHQHFSVALDKWHRIASTTLSAAGAYSLSGQANYRANSPYRVYLPARSGNATAWSGGVTYTAYASHFVADLPLADALNSDYINTGATTVNGIIYAQARRSGSASRTN